MSNYFDDPRASYGGALGMNLIDLVRQGRGRGGRARPDWATKQAMALINAQVKAIQQAKQMYLEELQGQAQLERERGEALSDWYSTQDVPGKIAGIWGAASGDLRGLAGALGAAQASGTDAQLAGMDRMVSGTGQEGTLGTPGGVLGDLTYGTGGELPGAALDYTGKGFASEAAFFPTLARMDALQRSSDIMAEGMPGLKDFLLKIAEARAQRPGLIQEFRSQRKDERLAASDRRFERYLKLAALAIQQGDQARANQYLELAKRDRALSEAKFAAEQAEAAKRGPSPEQVQERNDTLASAPEDLDEFLLSLYTKNEFTGKETPPDFVTAYRAVYDRAKSLLGRYGIKDRRIKQLVMQVLEARGIRRTDRDGEGPGR